MLAGVNTQNRAQRFLTPVRRKWLTYLWVIGVVAYDATRAFVISTTLSEHGVNGIWYFIFEISISIPYSLCSLRLIFSIVDKKMSQIYIFGSLTTILFFAPDIYVFIVSNDLSAKIYLIYGSILLVTTSFTVWGIFREVRKKRDGSPT